MQDRLLCNPFLLEISITGELSLLRLTAGNRHLRYGLLQLAAYLRNMLHLLHSCLMALQRRLDHLSRLTLTLCQYFQLLRVLLFLLKHLLVHLASLLRLLHQLLYRLLACGNLPVDVIDHESDPPQENKFGLISPSYFA